MNENHFDSLIRILAESNTRRDSIRRLGGVVLGGALLGVPAVREAAAHNPLPACRRIKNKKRRAACIRRAKRHNAQHQPANPPVDPPIDPPVDPPTEPPCTAKEARKGEYVDPDLKKWIDTTARLNCDGLLAVTTTTRNTHDTQGFRGRVRIVAIDAAGNTWKSRLFECGTLCSYWDPTCGFPGPKERTDGFTDHAPAEFARRVVRLEIYHAHNVDPLP